MQAGVEVAVAGAGHVEGEEPADLVDHGHAGGWAGSWCDEEADEVEVGRQIRWGVNGDREVVGALRGDGVGAGWELDVVAPLRVCDIRDGDLETPATPLFA